MTRWTAFVAGQAKTVIESALKAKLTEHVGYGYMPTRGLTARAVATGA